MQPHFFLASLFFLLKNWQKKYEKYEDKGCTHGEEIEINERKWEVKKIGTFK